MQNATIRANTKVIKSRTQYGLVVDPKQFRIDTFGAIAWPDPFPGQIPSGKTKEKIMTLEDCNNYLTKTIDFNDQNQHSNDFLFEAWNIDPKMVL